MAVITDLTNGDAWCRPYRKADRDFREELKCIINFTLDVLQVVHGFNIGAGALDTDYD